MHFTGSWPPFADSAAVIVRWTAIVGRGEMSRQQVAGTLGTAAMLAATLSAVAIVRLITTDPLSVAALATAGDVFTLLGRVASSIVGWL